jgi:hypothetical protein
MFIELQKAMQKDYGEYELRKTRDLAFKVMPDIDSLIVGAVALLEMAQHIGPCCGPQVNLGDAIRACKAALLFDYDNLPQETGTPK